MNLTAQKIGCGLLFAGQAPVHGGYSPAMSLPEQNSATVEFMPPKRETAAWVLYDVANTVYAATITFLFAPYLTRTFGLAEPLGIAQTISMVIAGLSAPFMAAIADRTGRAVGYVSILSLVCVGAMLCFALGLPLMPMLIAFGVANFAYHGALVFYNALLPSVASAKRIGLVSGLGVGLGYFGTLLTLFALVPAAEKLGDEWAFALAAGMFLLMALPCMVLVKERRQIYREKFGAKLLAERFRTVVATIRGLKRDRKIRRFLIGNFLAVDVLNTAILMFAVYSLRVFDGTQFSLFGAAVDLRSHYELGTGELFHPGKSTFLMILGGALNGLALGFGLLIGFLADRIGSLKSMRIAVAALMLALLGGSMLTADTWSTAQLRELRTLARSQDLVGPEDQRLQDFAQKNGAKLVPVDAEVLEERRRTAAQRPSELANIGSLASSGPAEPAELEVAVFERPPPPAWLPLAFLLTMGVFGSLGLAGIWTAGRKVVVELAPPDRLGEYFGLYGITLKLSVFGGWIFASLLDRQSPAAAMLSQVAVAALALVILCTVEPRQRKVAGPVVEADG